MNTNGWRRDHARRRINFAAPQASKRHTRQLVEELIAGAPGGTELPLELEGPWPDPADATAAYAWMERVDVIDLRDGIQVRWQDLRCFEIVFSELEAKELGGEDPLLVPTRELLQEARRRLSALHKKVMLYAGNFELPEPDPQDLASMRGRMKRRPGR